MRRYIVREADQTDTNYPETDVLEESMAVAQKRSMNRQTACVVDTKRRSRTGGSGVNGFVVKLYFDGFDTEPGKVR